MNTIWFRMAMWKGPQDHSLHCSVEFFGCGHTSHFGQPHCCFQLLSWVGLGQKDTWKAWTFQQNALGSLFQLSGQAGMGEERALYVEVAVPTSREPLLGLACARGKASGNSPALSLLLLSFLDIISPSSLEDMFKVCASQAKTYV